MVKSTAVSCIHPVIQTSTIILWTELFPKKRREKIQGENFNLSSSTVVFPQKIQELQELQCFHMQSSKFPVIPCYSTYRINSTTRNLQEILQLQGSSCAGSFQQLFSVSASILYGRIKLPASLQYSRAIQHKQASSNSRR